MCTVNRIRITVIKVLIDFVEGWRGKVQWLAVQAHVLNSTYSRDSRLRHEAKATNYTCIS